MKGHCVRFGLVVCFAALACGGGGDGITDEGPPADPGKPDPGIADPGQADPGAPDPGTTDPTPETAGDTAGDTGGPSKAEWALQIILDNLPDDADGLGFNAWGTVETIPVGTEITNALGDPVHTTAQEGWFVYVDPNPVAMLAHEVIYALVPSGGGQPVTIKSDMPPDVDIFASGAVMVQKPASAGLPVEPSGGRAATGDWGDAPDELNAYVVGTTGYFPTHESHDGAYVEATGKLVLGKEVSVEAGAEDPLDPDGIPNLTDGDADDGLLWAIWKGPTGDWWHRAVVTITVAADGPDVQYLNLLADLDRDGTWDEPDDRERPIKNFETDVTPGSSKDIEIKVPLPPDALALDGAFWSRLALTKDPIPDGWIGAGDLGDGEVEDYFIHINDVGGGEEPLPPGPGGGPGPGPVDKICNVDVHKRAIVVRGVDLPTKDHIVESTANAMGSALKKMGYDIGSVVSGTPEQVTEKLKAFFLGTSCLDEAIVYFIAHGSDKDGGRMVFAGGKNGTRWKAEDIFKLLKGLGACPGGKLTKGECVVTGKACRQTIMFESCHSGSFAAQVSQFDDGGAGRNVFFSSAGDTNSLAWNGMGVFTSSMLAGLNAGLSPEKAFEEAQKKVEEFVKKKTGKVQKPQKGASKPAKCPCDCCGDGTIQTSQKEVFGVLQPKPKEECDPAANPDGCVNPDVCSDECLCGSDDPCGNNEHDFWEECDPTATPTGCPTGEKCSSDCHCQPCVPDCTDKTCGDDGCGGQCQPGCSGQDECENGECVCKPACDGKECGGDGCGGNCPPGCTGALMCDADGKCVCQGDTFQCGIMCCQPSQKCVQNECCTPKDCIQMEMQCGKWDDGCGTELNCGECDGDHTCNESGFCDPISPYKSPMSIVSGPERIQFARFLSLYAYSILMAIGPMGNTAGLYNAETGAKILEDSFAHGYAAYLIQHPAGPLTMLGCGAGSCWYKTYDDTYGWNVMTIGLPFLGNITDMVRLPEADPKRVLYVANDNDMVGLLQTYTDPGGAAAWKSEGGVFYGSLATGKNGSFISAWGPSYTDSTFVAVTDTGELWWISDWDTNTSSKVADSLGTSLRQVRCADDHCGITDYGSKNLTLVQWAAPGAAPVVKGTVTVGDGAVGMDVRKDGANWLYLTTGFNDNTYTLTTVAPDFSIVSNVTTPLTDCTNPGHATFHEDHSIRYLVVSCNGNGKALILEY